MVLHIFKCNRLSKKSKTLKKNTLYMIISGNVIKDYNINNVRQVLKGNAM